MKTRWSIFSGLLVVGVSTGCGSGSEGGLPTSAPTKVELLAKEGFHNVGAVAASPDGKRFYAAAYTDDGQAAVFAVDATDESVQALYTGPPLLYPSDVATSCSGKKLFVSDMGLGTMTDQTGEFDDLDQDPPPLTGGIHVLASDGSSIQELSATGILRAAGMVVSVDCKTALRSRLDRRERARGVHGADRRRMRPRCCTPAPAGLPTGIHVDAEAGGLGDGPRCARRAGRGILFAIDGDGKARPSSPGLGMGRHGGVSLAPGGVTAVIPSTTATARSQLLTANTESGEQRPSTRPT